MPSAEEILEGLGAIANAWPVLAIGWHVYFAALAVLFLTGWRPAKRLLAALLLPPLASVGILAWLGGNPFNATMFGLLCVALLLLLRRVATGTVVLAAGGWLAVGTLLFGFGWVYPHFLDAASLGAYLYSAPLGLVPCPTLAVVAGVAILFRGLGSLSWSLAIALAGVFYGLFGALYLRVDIDWALFAGASSFLLQTGLAIRPKPRPN
jgi:hypothetical protein